MPSLGTAKTSTQMAAISLKKHTKGSEAEIFLYMTSGCGYCIVAG